LQAAPSIREWASGKSNVPLGRLKPGDAMIAHICMVFTVKDGRIVAQRNYDCYEEFA
jgi:ketosteroid isomerase-like protein